MTDFIIRPAAKSDYNRLVDLLKTNNLPVGDIVPDLAHFFVAEGAGQLIGTAGLEVYGTDGLLRSMAVEASFRKQGVAAGLLATVFDHARKTGLKEMYLLTETASAYFQKKGFRVVKREDVPQSIQQSTEFSHICSSSATVMQKEINSKKRLLFVCIENSNRSQMSQAFAQIHGQNEVEAYSAGSNPSGIVNPKAIAAMKELRYDLSVHESKSLKEVEQYAPFDVVVTMGCGDACPWMPAKQFIDWQIPDPKHMDPESFNGVRDLISEKVKSLIASLH